MAISNPVAQGAIVNSTAATSVAASRSGAPAGDVTVGTNLFILISKDNNGTTDADHSEVTSISDNAGGGGAANTYTKIAEYTNGEGAAGSGVTASLWYCRVTRAIAQAGTFTINFSHTCTDEAIQFYSFDSPNTLLWATPTQGATDASTSWPSMALSGLASREYLYLACLTREANISGNSLTVSSGFTSVGGTRSRNNAAAVIIRGEYKIATSTGDTSAASLATSAGDNAGVFAAFYEDGGAAPTPFGWYTATSQPFPPQIEIVSY
jgi:hypothetical protein